MSRPLDGDLNAQRLLRSPLGGPGQEQRLDTEREQFRQLAEALPQIVWTARPDGVQDYLNQRWFEYTGLSAEESQGDAWMRAFHPDDLPEHETRWRHSLATSEPFEVEKRCRRLDGVWRWFLVRAIPVRDPQGRVIRWFGTCTDIDDQKRTSDTHGFLAEASSLLALTLDPEETLRHFTRLAVPRLADWCAVDLVGADEAVERSAVTHADPVKESLAWELARRAPVDLQLATHGTGHVIRTGEPELLESISDAMRSSMARDPDEFRLLSEVGLCSSMTVPMVVHGRTLGAITLAQSQTHRGFSAADLPLAEEFARRAALALDNARMYRASQEAVSRAQHERHQAEQARAMLDTLLDAAPAGIALFDRLLCFVRVNRALRDINRLPGDGPDNPLSEAISTQGPGAALVVQSLVKALETGETQTVESTSRMPSGEERAWLARYAPVRSAEGSTLGVATVVLDITERKRAEAERERLIAALERSNQELDQFAYVASHDLKAPLRGIANLSQWIEDDLQGVMTEETREQMRLLRGRVQRMESLINGILDYSRAGRMRGRPERVDVGRLVAECVELLAPPESTHVELAPNLPMLQYAERVPLQQVFLNLLGNAFKHAAGADARVHVEVRPAEDFWEFSVRDNGPGIAPEYHERIWGIFQTLQARDQVEGTGIGLSVVKKSVEARGGRAWLESAPGQGATFRFTWPHNTPDEGR
ncbi:PAS domain-containing sensor histidine kinase [Melittangium boletus]|uniref:histidine kinase n=1 Tax=Melittangium boletus DSM 14713 TaxID=1294270 RepID=A0A250IHM4_9BACT|nr:PAS domain-containing protein [Melittangium boletus]ATB31245.1 two-component sensor histidine kinase [Melittangium boletus DSM 14713]